MLRRLAIPLILVAAILAASLGLTRLRFDTDILSMLPPGLPEVKGLKAFHQGFSRDNELILVIEGEESEAGILPEAAKSLGEALTSKRLAGNARWQPLWNENPDAIAELISYLWLNGDPLILHELASSLAQENSKQTLGDSHARAATALEGVEMVMAANDPFGFLNQPAIRKLMDSASESGAFESQDGRTHLLFVDSPRPLAGYQEAGKWLEDVRATIREWQTTDGAGLTVRLTGEPAFASEIGNSMEKDLSGSISITLGLIGLLFWWMQRRFSLLLGLAGVLILVFAVALGIAGWIYGELSIMALCSIEILIGLAVDYGLVVCQEAKVAGHDRRKLLLASGRPIMFGALTTTLVFLALNLGGLPGMAQLGNIVAVGLLAAAILMLLLYLPFVTKFGVDRAPASGDGSFLPRSRRSWWITGVLIIVSLVSLATLGLPTTNFNSSIMRPQHSEAMESFEHVQSAYPTSSPNALGLILEATSDDEMNERSAVAKRRIDHAIKSGTLSEANLPTDWWPNRDVQAKNRSDLAAISKDRDRLLDEADAAGYSDEGLALSRAVLGEFSRISSSESLVFPESEAAREVMRLFVSRNDQGGGWMLGSVISSTGVEMTKANFERMRHLTGDGIWLTSWEMFKPAIAELVREDMGRMLVPMFVVLLGMMALIFRNAADVFFSFLAMCLSGLVLLAIMSATGLKWNFVNLMATPLILGTGIDYSIHVTLSLRRTGGNLKDLWQGTGKALLFCGASNVIGFGSLIFSSSEALVSLGVVAVIGIVLCMLTSIFLLPGWIRQVPR